MSIQITVETITPQIAEAYLSTNENPRKVTWGWVYKYAEDMKNGRWKLSSATIAFDKHGNLKDGQHRLHACIKSGCSFQTLVVRGMEDGADAVVDIGKTRSASDQLKGYEYSDKIAALAKMARATKSGSMGLGISSFLEGRSCNEEKAQRQVTIPEQVEDAKENIEEYTKCAQMGNKLRGLFNKHGITIYAYFIWLVRWLGEGEQVEEYIDDICASKQKSTTTSAVRTYIFKQQKGKENRTLALAALLYGYKAFCDGKEIEVIRQPLKVFAVWEEKIRAKKKELYGPVEEEKV